MVSVGLMLDPITHVIFAYSEARGSRNTRLTSGLSTIGISVLAGSVSTAISCCVMLGTTIVAFYRFALLFVSLVAVHWRYQARASSARAFRAAR